ncbi:MAG: WhiB family transcriptional regulator [Paracoccus sp. (in: a-proteobacteria)]
MMFDLPDDPWRGEALCAEVGSEWFFPEPGGSATTALKLCESCLVRVECLTYAEDNNIRYGVWGGTTPNSRRVDGDGDDW